MGEHGEFVGKVATFSSTILSVVVVLITPACLILGVQALPTDAGYADQSHVTVQELPEHQLRCVQQGSAGCVQGCAQDDPSPTAGSRYPQNEQEGQESTKASSFVCSNTTPPQDVPLPPHLSPGTPRAGITRVHTGVNATGDGSGGGPGLNATGHTTPGQATPQPHAKQGGSETPAVGGLSDYKAAPQANPPQPKDGEPTANTLPPPSQGDRPPWPPSQENAKRQKSSRNPGVHPGGGQAGPGALKQDGGVGARPHRHINWNAVLTVVSLLVVAVFSMFGIVHVFKLLTRASCGCRLCLKEFRVQGVLGEGGFGKVLRVTRNGKSYVLKKVPVRDASDANDAQLEARRLRALNHPNIVKYVDDFLHAEGGSVWDTGATMHVCIVMEYCAGGDLHSRIAANAERMKFFTQKQVMAWFLQLLEPLRHLHAQHLVHRDIKPANVFLTLPSHALRLGDFGLARVLRRGSLAMTECGTESYTSPEVLMGAPFSEKSDLWALGLLLWELVSLRCVSDYPGVIAAQVLADAQAGRAGRELCATCHSLATPSTTSTASLTRQSSLTSTLAPTPGARIAALPPGMATSATLTATVLPPGTTTSIITASTTITGDTATSAATVPPGMTISNTSTVSTCITGLPAPQNNSTGKDGGGGDTMGVHGNGGGGYVRMPSSACGAGGSGSIITSATKATNATIQEATPGEGAGGNEVRGGGKQNKRGIEAQLSMSDGGAAPSNLPARSETTGQSSLSLQERLPSSGTSGAQAASSETSLAKVKVSSIAPIISYAAPPQSSSSPLSSPSPIAEAGALGRDLLGAGIMGRACSGDDEPLVSRDQTGNGMAATASSGSLRQATNSSEGSRSSGSHSGSRDAPGVSSGGGVKKKSKRRSASRSSGQRASPPKTPGSSTSGGGVGGVSGEGAGVRGSGGGALAVTPSFAHGQSVKAQAVAAGVALQPQGSGRGHSLPLPSLPATQHTSAYAHGHTYAVNGTHQVPGGNGLALTMTSAATPVVLTSAGRPLTRVTAGLPPPLTLPPSTAAPIVACTEDGQGPLSWPVEGPPCCCRCGVALGPLTRAPNRTVERLLSVVPPRFDKEFHQLIGLMLLPDPEERPTASQLLANRFVARYRARLRRRHFRAVNISLQRSRRQ
eukprot:jgi/Mesvir1/29290/Mv01555-RA.1